MSSCRRFLFIPHLAINSYKPTCKETIHKIFLEYKETKMSSRHNRRTNLIKTLSKDDIHEVLDQYGAG